MYSNTINIADTYFLVGKSTQKITIKTAIQVKINAEVNDTMYKFPCLEKENHIVICTLIGVLYKNNVIFDNIPKNRDFYLYMLENSDNMLLISALKTMTNIELKDIPDFDLLDYEVQHENSTFKRSPGF